MKRLEIEEGEGVKNKKTSNIQPTNKLIYLYVHTYMYAYNDMYVDVCLPLCAEINIGL